MGRLIQLWDDEVRREAHWYDISVAVAALMVETMRMDGDHDLIEHDRIAELLEHRFHLGNEQTESLIAEADGEVNRELDPDHFARAVCAGFTPEQRMSLLTDLWRVVVSAGAPNDYEERLLSRVGTLLGIDEEGRGEARAMAMVRGGMFDTLPPLRYWA